MTAASIHFAHLSRLFTIRTVSQMQNAVKVIPRTVNRVVILSREPEDNGRQRAHERENKRESNPGIEAEDFQAARTVKLP
jgi:hypothetical protein